MFGKSLISSGGMGLATALGAALNAASQRRREQALIDQENYRIQALERERKFIREHKRFLNHKEMEARYEPLKRNYSAALKSQTRFAEIAGFFAQAGIDPSLVLDPKGPSVQQLIELFVLNQIEAQEQQPTASHDQEPPPVAIEQSESPVAARQSTVVGAAKSVAMARALAMGTTCNATEANSLSPRADMLLSKTPALGLIGHRVIRDVFAKTAQSARGAGTLAYPAMLALQENLRNTAEQAKASVHV